jgi:hypothetical protein
MATKKKTAAKKSNGASKGRAVLVTTEHRGVFFGYARKTDGGTIDLKASNGPTSGCRIGPAADITLRKITAVLAVTPEAERAWLGAPWTS